MPAPASGDTDQPAVIAPRPRKDDSKKPLKPTTRDDALGDDTSAEESDTDIDTASLPEGRPPKILSLKVHDKDSDRPPTTHLIYPDDASADETDKKLLVAGYSSPIARRRMTAVLQGMKDTEKREKRLKVWCGDSKKGVKKRNGQYGSEK